MTTHFSARRAGLYGAFGLLALFVLLVALRAAILFEITQGLADCPSCMAATAAQQDASVLALMLLCVALSFLTRNYLLQLPWILVGTVLVVVYAVDAAVLKTLTQRLFVFDIVKFGKELGAIAQFSGIFFSTRVGKAALFVAAVGFMMLVPAILPRPRRPRLALALLGLAAAAFIAGLWQPPTMKYIHYELLQNVLAANLSLGVDKPYSTAFAEQIASRYSTAPAVCEPGRALRPDIIVVTVESLSMHHSQLFGGFRDLTPRLDRIAREHTWFPDFIANGFTTDGGLIAMITGRAPVPLIGRYESAEAFTGYDDPAGALPDIVHAEGYTAHFFTTGDLGFLDKSKWLKALHFDSWEGAEQAFYNGWKRRHFNAAEDKALYQRFLQWLDTRQDSAPPFLAFLLTVSTHPPFINPETEQPDEPGVFRYADSQIGMLYDELSRRGFFRNGILMISGDHRSMSPLLAPEQSRFGDSALARTPFVVATDLPITRGAVPGLFSQTDIPPSVADLISVQACRSPDQGTFVHEPAQPPAYVLHARGDKRNEIDVYFGKHQAEIVLDGDKTRWEGKKPADWQRVMDGLLLDRIRRGAVEQNMIDVIVKMRTPQTAPPAPAPETR